jgi:hypothetical protein
LYNAEKIGSECLGQLFVCGRREQGTVSDQPRELRSGRKHKVQKATLDDFFFMESSKQFLFACVGAPYPARTRTKEEPRGRVDKHFAEARAGVPFECAATTAQRRREPEYTI